MGGSVIIEHARNRRSRMRLSLGLTACLWAHALAAQTVEFEVTDGSEGLADSLRAASVVVSTLAGEGPVPVVDLMAAARAEYGRLVEALYAQGHYSPAVSVRVDGREAADIPVLNDPDSISRIDISVEPGPIFAFSGARIAPLAQGTTLPSGFVAGAPAPAPVIREAVGAAIEGWRDVGHAKADIARQRVVADHRAATLDADITLDPGPRLRFGTLTVKGYERTRPDRIRAIAGYPEGEVFSPAEVQRTVQRLRRTGAFRAVSASEAETPEGDTLPIEILLEEELPRRLGFGAELSSTEGVRLSGYWMHRNLLRGAEQLRFDAEIGGIGGETGGEDYRLSVGFVRPATFSPDIRLTLGASAEKLAEPDYDLTGFGAEIGIERVFSDTLTGAVGLEYRVERVEDALGASDFQILAVPVSAIWDRRNDTLNPSGGFYLDAEAKPFLGLNDAGSGLRLWADARAYRGFGAENGIVAAGRVQLGTVFGPSLAETPRNFLFYSGGGGTVRGHDYQSLGVEVLTGGGGAIQRTGGQHFLGLQTELRTSLTEKIGVVGFVDAGYVAASDWGETDDWHAGAGLGLRYNTGIGPIRVDLAVPVHGEGSGFQIYIGIGQAF